MNYDYLRLIPKAVNNHLPKGPMPKANNHLSCQGRNKNLKTDSELHIKY